MLGAIHPCCATYRGSHYPCGFRTFDSRIPHERRIRHRRRRRHSMIRICIQVRHLGERAAWRDADGLKLRTGGGGDEGHSRGPAEGEEEVEGGEDGSDIGGREGEGGGGEGELGVQVGDFSVGEVHEPRRGGIGVSEEDEKKQKGRIGEA
jgi:hypothetical protein